MDKRTIEFIRCLRAAGVRISLAESQDAMMAVDTLGVSEREGFRDALRVTLIKDNPDNTAFDHFFPLFFDKNTPPMTDMGEELSPDQMEALREALQALMGDREALQELMRQLMEGRPFSQEELDQMGQQTGLPMADSMYQENWFNRRMQRLANLDQLRDLLDQLMEMLREMGMSDQARQEIRDLMEANAEALAEQLSKYTGSSIAERMSEQEPEARQDVQDLDFQYMTAEQAEQVRDEIRRLAARLRSRAALRQKRANDGQIDPKKTIRHNLRYGGVPMELQHRTHHVKPKVAVICDLSGSMRYMSEFSLTLTYMLHDVVAKTRSFVFIDNMVEVTQHFNAERPEAAVQKVLRENPRGYYSTDLGRSLATFKKDFMDAVDSKTTVLFVGDGRNNYNNPRLDIAEDLSRMGRRVIWFCPEATYQWGTGDSDMHLYAQKAKGVYLVRNLRELGQAVDDILSDG
jgi:uncharacterized protein with von Willebrand factor type A (vWA) domain